MMPAVHSFVQPPRHGQGDVSYNDMCRTAACAASSYDQLR